VAFRGQFEHSLDAKDRLTIPAKFRAALADGVVLSKGIDSCVWIQTEASFDAMSDRYIAPHSPFGEGGRDMRRLINASAFDDGLDSAGRVKVPKLLKDHAGLDGNCIVIGAGDYLEIWNGDAWQKKSEELDREAATIAEGISRSSE